MNRFWSAVEVFNRDLLHCVTALIPDDEVAGLVFGVGVIVSDLALQPLKWVLR